MEDHIISTEEQSKMRVRYLESFEKGTFHPPKIMDLICEMQLDALGDFVPLNVDIKLSEFEKEIKQYNDKWIPYLHREGTMNDREGLNLVGLPGDTPTDSLSMPEAIKRTGRNLNELDFDTPTQLYHDLPSLHPILNYFPKLGRCTLVKVNQGGWFPRHRDGVLLQRKTFRVVCFLRNTSHQHYQWEHDYTIRQIEPGKCYYVDTKKEHRTHSYTHGSIHLVMNIPKTYENVLRIIDILDARES